MATELEGIKMARPMTHDLLRNVLGELGATVEAIEVTDLRENTYFALIHLRVAAIGARPSIARPSDAISLGAAHEEPDLRRQEGARGLERAAADRTTDKDSNLSNVSRDKWAEILEKMSPDDFKYKM